MAYEREGKMSNKGGRPRIDVSEALLENKLDLFLSGKITAAAAAASIGVSRMTFFRRLREYRAAHSNNISCTS